MNIIEGRKVTLRQGEAPYCSESSDYEFRQRDISIVDGQVVIGEFGEWFSLEPTNIVRQVDSI